MPLCRYAAMPLCRYLSYAAGGLRVDGPSGHLAIWAGGKKVAGHTNLPLFGVLTVT